MKISIIIPTYNEASVIENCLDSLLNQSIKDFEIIMVDDGSSDGTLEILKQYSQKYAYIKFYKQNHQGAGSARNFGASKSKGEILVFVDADMTFDNSFIKNLVSPIREQKTKGTFSKQEMVSNWENVWSRCWNANEGWEDGRRHSKNYPHHQPVFRAILKSEFSKVGGFTPGGYNDDWSLYHKLGYEALNAKDAIFYHKNPSSLDEIFRHARWVGKRPYKLGVAGYIIALIRASVPVSLIVGMYKSVVYKIPAFIIFKIVYDFGIFIGILEYLQNGKGSK